MAKNIKNDENLKINEEIDEETAEEIAMRQEEISSFSG